MDVGCILIPHYPAWVLLQHGADSPLAVIGRGRVIAAGPAARDNGVESGMRAGRARSLCGGINLRPRDAALESAQWEHVEETLNRTTPYIERAELGRSFIHPHHLEKLERFVEKIGARGALAPTRTDAHLAARKAVGGELLAISEEHREAFRRGLSVDRLMPLGVDAEIVERLKLFGYETVAAAATLSKRHLTAQFGEAGEELHASLHATNESSVSAYTPPPSVEVKHRYERPKREPGPIEETVDTLIEDAVEELDGRTAQRVAIQLNCRRKGTVVATRTLREARGTEHALCTTVCTLLRRRLSSGMAVEEIEVRLSALARPDAQQGHLFFERPAVRKAVEAVHRKYPGVLRYARLERDAVFTEDQICYEPATTPSPETPASTGRTE